MHALCHSFHTLKTIHSIGMHACSSAGIQVEDEFDLFIAKHYKEINEMMLAIESAHAAEESLQPPNPKRTKRNSKFYIPLRSRGVALKVHYDYSGTSK